MLATKQVYEKHFYSFIVEEWFYLFIFFFAATIIFIQQYFYRL